ncbi:MAG: hypothetical protein ACP5GJ_03885 [Nanopusillaceae archaeon]|jgi:hypothetical protein
MVKSPEEAIKKYEEDIRSQQALNNYCKKIAEFLQVSPDVVCQSLPAKDWEEAVKQSGIGQRWYEDYKAAFLSRRA